MSRKNSRKFRVEFIDNPLLDQELVGLLATLSPSERTDLLTNWVREKFIQFKRDTGYGSGESRRSMSRPATLKVQSATLANSFILQDDFDELASPKRPMTSPKKIIQDVEDKPLRKPPKKNTSKQRKASNNGPRILNEDELMAVAESAPDLRQIEQQMELCGPFVPKPNVAPTATESPKVESSTSPVEAAPKEREDDPIVEESVVEDAIGIDVLETSEAESVEKEAEVEQATEIRIKILPEISETGTDTNADSEAVADTEVIEPEFAEPDLVEQEPVDQHECEGEVKDNIADLTALLAQADEEEGIAAPADVTEKQLVDIWGKAKADYGYQESWGSDEADAETSEDEAGTVYKSISEDEWEVTDASEDAALTALESELKARLKTSNPVEPVTKPATQPAALEPSVDELLWADDPEVQAKAQAQQEALQKVHAEDLDIIEDTGDEDDTDTQGGGGMFAFSEDEEEEELVISKDDALKKISGMFGM